jgi:hypothetical protein
MRNSNIDRPPEAADQNDPLSSYPASTLGQLPFDSLEPHQSETPSLFGSLRAMIRRRRAAARYTVRARRSLEPVYQPSFDSESLSLDADQRVNRLAHRLSQQSLKEPESEDLSLDSAQEDQTRFPELNIPALPNFIGFNANPQTCGVLDFLTDRPAEPQTPNRIAPTAFRSSPTSADLPQTPKPFESRKRSHSQVSVDSKDAASIEQRRESPLGRPTPADPSTPPSYVEPTGELPPIIPSQDFGEDFENEMDPAALMGTLDAVDLKCSGILPYRRAADAAMQCPGLVRNAPRMRKRHKVKRKETRPKPAAANSTDASSSNVVPSPTPITS